MSGEGDGPDEQTPQPDGDVHRAAGGRSLFGRAVLYPNVYVWYVFLASLDVILTYLILHPLFSSPSSFLLTQTETVNGPPAHIEPLPPLEPLTYEERGVEHNTLADWIIQRWAVPGMVAFKFALVILVVCICEVVGRRKRETGRRLAEWAVAISAIPVVVALVQMAVDVYSWVLS